ncbi:MAG: GNAT family N-acetyltransferase [Isosphaeraceae bacterium]
MIVIRDYRESDWASLWPLLRGTFQAGDTYAYAPESTEGEIHRAWIEIPSETHVACDEAGEIVGTYFLRPNQPGLGSHVSNCGYIVAPRARGKGVATRMCEHSQARARSLGFAAMQFNFVVSTNEGAVRLWQRLGFAIVGRLPGAFRHRELGYVDAFVMYKRLVDGGP